MIDLIIEIKSIKKNLKNKKVFPTHIIKNKIKFKIYLNNLFYLKKIV